MRPKPPVQMAVASGQIGHQLAGAQAAHHGTHALLAVMDE
jgi:hypothetical protein